MDEWTAWYKEEIHRRVFGTGRVICRQYGQQYGGVFVISEGPGKTGQILTCSEASLCGQTWYANRVARGGWAAVQHVKHYVTVREPLLSTL